MVLQTTSYAQQPVVVSKDNQQNFDIRQINSNPKQLLSLKKQLRFILATPKELKSGWYNVSGNFYKNDLIQTSIYDVDYDNQEFCVTSYLNGAANNPYPVAVFFDKKGSLIGVDKSFVSTSPGTRIVNHKITAPIGAKIIACGSSAFPGDRNAPFYVEKAVQVNNTKGEHTFVSGGSDAPEIIDGLNHIVSYGQSLAIGGSSKYVEDTEIAGCSTVGTVLTPADYLGRLVLTSNGQAPVVSATNSLATLVHQYSNPGAKFIAGCYGRGSQSIAQLMSPARQAQIKAERGFDYDIVSAGCWQFFTDAVDYAAQMIVVRKSLLRASYFYRVKQTIMLMLVVLVKVMDVVATRIYTRCIWRD